MFRKKSPNFFLFLFLRWHFAQAQRPLTQIKLRFLFHPMLIWVNRDCTWHLLFRGWFFSSFWFSSVLFSFLVGECFLISSAEPFAHFPRLCEFSIANAFSRFLLSLLIFAKILNPLALHTDNVGNFFSESENDFGRFFPLSSRSFKRAFFSLPSNFLRGLFYSLPHTIMGRWERLGFFHQNIRW